MSAILLALLLPASADLRQSVADLADFEGARLEITSKIHLPIGDLKHFTNEEGDVVLVGDKQAAVVTQQGTRYIRLLRWEHNVEFFRRSPDRTAIVMGDGEHWAALFRNGHWVPFNKVSASWFESNERLALVPDFNFEDQPIPSALPIEVRRADYGSLRAGGWDFKFANFHRDDIKDRLYIRGHGYFLSFLTQRYELDWPGMRFAPMLDGGLLQYLEGRGKLSEFGVVFNSRTGATLECHGVPHVAGGRTVYLIQTGIDSDKPPLLLSTDGKRSTAWHHDWIPIWWPGQGVVFFRRDQDGVNIAIARPF